MNALDLAFLLILLLCPLHSTWRGFVRDVFSLAGLLGGFFVAFQFYIAPAQWLMKWLHKPLIANILGWVLIFMLTYLAASMLGQMLRRSLKVLQLGWLDRTAGFMFGLIKGVFLCAGIVVVLVAFLPTKSSLFRDSRLAPYVIGISWELGSLVPGKLGDRFRDGPPSSGAIKRETAVDAEEREL